MADNYDYKGRVVRIKEEFEGVKSFWFELDRKMSFKPGQFVNVRVKGDKGVMMRPYSIASSPYDSELMITVKNMRTGGMSQFLCENVKEGDFVEIKGPYGLFYYDDNYNSVVLAGGGVGVTPLVSIMKYIRDKGLKTRVLALFSFRTKDTILYKDELEELNSMDNFEVVITLTREPEDSEWKGERGRFDKDKVDRYVDERYRDAGVYICGTLGFVNSLESLFVEKGIDKKDIKKEGWG